MLDDFNCPAIDHKRRGEGGEHFFLLKSTIISFVLFTLKGTKREILSAMHVKELIQSNHSER